MINLQETFLTLGKNHLKTDKSVSSLIQPTVKAILVFGKEHYGNLSRQLSKVTTGKSFLQQNFLISAND